MCVVLLRDYFRRGLAVALCVLLAACGGSGGETVSDNPIGGLPPVSPPPVSETPIETGLMVAFGYSSLAAGAPLRINQVQNFAVGNGTANYRFPRSGESISGNLTIAVDVADPDGITRVLVGFNGSEQALVLCQASCGTAFSQTVTGVNPRNFGLTPGSLRLELWLEDQLGNRILFDARDIEWLPEPVVGVNTSRTAAALQVNWTANSSARRYNLYIAEQPGITPENVLSKTGGRQFLALSQPTFSVTELDASKRYFVLITGIDASGESLFSQEHVVQAIGIPDFSPPIAVPDQFTLNEDAVFGGLLLSNDSHPDGSSFTLDTQAVRSPDNGALELNADGSFTYLPAANFVGNDSFIYQITDSQGLTAQALVTLTVLTVNDLPTVLDDSYSTNKNTALSVAAPGVLANDLDIDGDSLVVDSIPVTAPAHGSLQLNTDGSFSYTPVFNFAGEDAFVYQVSDGQGAVVQAQVKLRIEMTNAAPVAQNDSYQLGEDEPLLVSPANGVLANDSDPDGDIVSLVTELLSVPENGQLLMAADGSFQYIPQQDFFGTDSFSYQIKDPSGLISAATVELVVLAKNDAPVVQGSSYSVSQNTLLSVDAPGLLAHVSDVDDQSLSIVVVPASAPTKGTLTLQANGAFSYQPKPTATGTDSFIYQVKDAAGAISTGTVVITIIASQTPPVIAELRTEIWDNAAQGEVIGQLVVESLEPGQIVSFSILSGNTQGIFGLTPAGVLSVANPAPLVQLAGSTVVLTVKAQDNAGLSAQINISVKILSTAVTAQNDSYTVQEDTLLVSTTSVLSNDTELRGSGLTASLITQPSHGTLQFNANGQFSYSPAANFNGQDSFVYSAGNGVRTAQATVFITVQAVNDSPVLSSSTVSISEALPAGALVAQLNWQDADTNQTYSFQIVSGDQTNAFTVNNLGQVLVANSSALLARNGAGGGLVIQITDNLGASGSATIGLQLISALPVLATNAYSVEQGSFLQVNAANGVLANDLDPSGRGLTATVASASAPAHGQLALNPDGSFSYQPTAGFYGQDLFVYQATNGARTASATVSMTVVQVLQANSDLYTLSEDALLTVQTANSLLKNDLFKQGLPVTVTLLQGPDSGSLNLNTEGTFTFQPVANMNGVVHFSYRLTQGSLTSDAQVTLNITPVNDAPALQDATVGITDDYANLQPVLTLQVADQDQGSYSYEIMSGNTGGVFAVTADGVIQVANAALLDAGVNSSYSLQVKVTENGDPALTDVATVVIHINHALLAIADSYTFSEDTLLTVQAVNSLLHNDIVKQGQPVAISLLQGTNGGTLNLSADGTFTFQPVANMYGSIYFSYRLTQGQLTSDAQVELNITPVNDAPTLQDAAVTISDDYVDMQHVLTLTRYDSDPGSYGYEIVSGDPTAVFAVTADGVIKVANASLLDAGTTSSYSLVVKVTENNDANLTDTATVLISVTAAVQNVTVVNPDAAFAGGGQLSIQMMLSGEHNDPVQVIPLSDGRSLVLGNVADSSDQEVFVARVNADGSLDSSYAEKGVFRSKIFSIYTTEQAVAAVLTSNNELVLLVNYSETQSSGFYLIKLSAEGALDYSFGNDFGYIICDAAQCGGNAAATDLLLNHLGHYVVSGVKNGSSAFLLEFANSGYQTGWISPLSSVMQFDLVRQDSLNNYYGVGQSNSGSIVIARFSSSYALDINTFGCNSDLPPVCTGYQLYDFSFAGSTATDAVIYENELHLVGRVTTSGAQPASYALFFKVTADGSLDPDFGNNAGFLLVSGYDGNPLHYRAITQDATGFYILSSTEEATEDVLAVNHYNLAGQFTLSRLLSVDGELKAADIVASDTGVWLLNQFSHSGDDSQGTASFNWVGKYQQTTLVPDPAFSAKGYRWFNTGESTDLMFGTKKLKLGASVNKTLFYGLSYSYVNGGYVQAFVGRLTASGSLDPSFGNHGVVLLGDEQLSEVMIHQVLEADANQIYVAGAAYSDEGDQAGLVMRLNQDGSLDTDFSGGVVALAPAQLGSYTESVVTKLLLKPDGHLLVGAEYSQAQGNSDIALLQLNTDGSLDSGNFGTSALGFVVLNAMDSNSQIEERLSQMELDPMDGTVLMAGQYLQQDDPQLYVARLSENGVLMNTANSGSAAFGTAGQGYSMINLVDSSGNGSDYSEYVNALDFDAGRNLVLAISKNWEGDEGHYLFRLEQSGLPDTTFNFGAPRLYNSFSDATEVNLRIKDIMVDASGRLLMAGTADANAWVGRVLLDGSGTDAGRWDATFEPDATIYGAYFFNNLTFSYDVVMELTSSKITLGWSKYDAGGYSLSLTQYQLYEYEPNPL